MQRQVYRVDPITGREGWAYVDLGPGRALVGHDRPTGGIVAHVPGQGPAVGNGVSVSPGRVVKRTARAS